MCPDGFMQDALLDTVQAITAIWNGRRDEVVVQWFDLPALIEFRFHREDDKLVLRIEEYPDGRRVDVEKVFVLECHDNWQAMCLKFWRALRKLDSQISPEKFAECWKHPFPTEALKSLTSVIKTNSSLNL